ncbi:MAG: pantoate--beta-alanine ligase [Gammaproteobacteria bacterium]|nr:MAG: pantoate--beta-alanine ligase [Gammaproteobacteria bacterium]
MIIGTPVSTGNRHAPTHCGSLFLMTLMRLPDPERARRWCAEQRADGRSIGFVPTMGALHEGHLALVRRAVADNDTVCVSIFVNPLQFNDPDDLARYPRDFDADAGQLERAGCEMVFTGTLEQFFPEAEKPDQIVTRDPGPCARGLEAAGRPGHFAGVATICERLFRVVGHGRAYFGEKDFQQSRVVKQLACELGFPEIVVCPTARESSGLAYSSRNVLLTDAERQQAACLSRALFAARRAWRSGERDANELRTVMLHELERAGVDPEYAELRDPHAWTADSPSGPMLRAQALVAARIGKARLIDNLRLDRGDDVGAQ